VISSLSGSVSGFSAGAVELEVAGVGYLVNVPVSVLAGLRLGEQVRILTHMVVREDSMTLYGFSGPDQRELFVSLMSVTGVGPKLALAILGAVSPAAFRKALVNDDKDLLTSVPGVGKRGAERIILELKERLGAGVSATEGGSSKMGEVRDALLGLGYSHAEFRGVLERTFAEAPEAAEVPELVKAALRELARL
jgi:Holliday junction DNA helicase RuvA